MPYPIVKQVGMATAATATNFATAGSGTGLKASISRVSHSGWVT